MPVNNNPLSEIESGEIERYQNYMINPIFDTAEELNDEIKKMESAYENDDVSDAADFLRKFSKSK